MTGPSIGFRYHSSTSGWNATTSIISAQVVIYPLTLSNHPAGEETDGYAVESLLYIKNCTEALSEEAAATMSLLSTQVKCNRLHHSNHEMNPVKCKLANLHGFFKFQSSGRFQVRVERGESEDMFKSVTVFEK